VPYSVIDLGPVGAPKCSIRTRYPRRSQKNSGNYAELNRTRHGLHRRSTFKGGAVSWTLSPRRPFFSRTYSCRKRKRQAHEPKSRWRYFCQVVKTKIYFFTPGNFLAGFAVYLSARTFDGGPFNQAVRRAIVRYRNEGEIADVKDLDCFRTS